MAGNKGNNRLNHSSDLSEGLGKLPPQSIDLEEAVLGAILIEKDAYNQIGDILKPHHFYREAHKDIYEAIVSLDSKSEPIDILTVTEKLRNLGKLELVGGAYYISELTSKVSQSSNIQYHSRIIIEKSVKREIIRISSNLHKQAYEDTIDTFEMLNELESELVKIHSNTQKKEARSALSISKDYVKKLIQISSEKKEITGVPSGFLKIDQKTCGWQDQDMIIIAARPGMGKTGLMLSQARNQTVMFKIPTAIFSLEMSDLQLMNRLYAIEGEIESEKIRHGKMDQHEWERLNHMILPKIEEAPLFIDDTPGITVMELKSKAKRLVLNHGIKIIHIDYIQLMHAGIKIGNREQEISYISRSIKELAKELNIPIIAYAQLSRAVEARGGEKRPQLSDLRESGSIEQDADIVGFIYRPEYYNIEVDGYGRSTKNLAQLDFAKHRNGSVGRRNLKFIERFTKFKDWEEDLPESQDVPEQQSIEFTSEYVKKNVF